MRWIARLINWLWQISRASWIDVGNGLRPHSGASALYIFLFLIFFIVGGILMLLGIRFNDADRWIDAQASWLDMLGSIILRIVFALILLVCAITIITGLYQRLPRRRPQQGRVGLGAMLAVLILGYFAAIGAFGRY